MATVSPTWICVTATQLPLYVLTFLADRVEMAHSVEGRVPVLDDQPFFDPKRVRAFMDRLAGLSAVEQGANEGVVLQLVSTCPLHDRFRMSA